MKVSDALLPTVSFRQDNEPKTKLLVSSFLSGKSRKTIKAYSQDLADFANFVGASNTVEASELLVSKQAGDANILVLSYKNSLLERGLQTATINRRLAALRSLVKLGSTFGLVSWKLEVPNLKSQTYRDTRGPGTTGFKSLLEQARQKKSAKSIRDHLALRLLYDLALRSSEVVSIDLADVNLENNTIAVKGKGKQSKETLTIPNPTKDALIEWLGKRGGEAGPLFTNFDRAGKGQRLSPISLYRIVRKLGEEIGLKVRPHGLRHTAITEACKAAQNNGIGLEEVLDFSRHSRKSLSILMIYRDRERNVQGQLASLVANGVQSLSAQPAST